MDGKLIDSDDGREVLFDLEGLNREQIEEQLAKTLGKTELVGRRYSLHVKMCALNDLVSAFLANLNRITNT